MKPVVTWIVLANAREVRVFANKGPGKGLLALARKRWQAEGVGKPRDKAGVGHSIAGPGISAVESTDPQRQSDMRFAQDVSLQLLHSFDAHEFGRLVLVAGPHMLGLLRATLHDRLKVVISNEIAKDLSAQPMDVLEGHLGEVIAV